MSALIFDGAFEGFPIRVVGTPEAPEWIGVDLGAPLDFADVLRVIRRFDDDEKGRTICPTPSGPQEMVTVTESGLWRLIVKSRKPAAKRLKKWLFGEVLPAIRKTGSYSVAQPEPTTLPAKPLGFGVIRAMLDQLEATGASVIELERRDREREAAFHQTQDDVDAQAAKLLAVERQVAGLTDASRKPGERTAAAVAAYHGWWSKSGNAHLRAVIAACRACSFEARGYMRQVMSPSSDPGKPVPVWLISAEGAREFAVIDKSRSAESVFKVASVGQTFTVYRERAPKKPAQAPQIHGSAVGAS